MTKGQDLYRKALEGRNQICLVGFADSKRQLVHFLDESWVRFGVNNLYHFVPGVDVVFEMHHTDNMGNRRHDTHEESLRTGQFVFAEQPNVKRELPVFMQETFEHYPTSIALPRNEIVTKLGVPSWMGNSPGAEYFTNSISWMIALAILELTEEKKVGAKKVRVAKEGAKLALVGIHMAAESEYASQRPNCEYWIGRAQSYGIELYLPDESDLLSSASLYGYVTSNPIAVKIESRMQTLREQTIQLQQQEMQLVQSLEACRGQLAGVRGAKMELDNIRRNYTMPTDIGVGDQRGLTEQQMADRQPVLITAQGVPLTQIPVSDGQVMQEVH